MERNDRDRAGVASRAAVLAPPLTTHGRKTYVPGISVRVAAGIFGAMPSGASSNEVKRKDTIMKLTYVTLFLVAGPSITLGVASASETSDRRLNPPPAAFEACSGKANGDRCTVSFRDRSIDGTCKTIPQDDRLICVPDHAPPGPPPDRSNP